jgi:3-dehydroquinate synthase
MGVAALSAAAFMLQAGRKRKATGRVQKVLVNSRSGEAVEVEFCSEEVVETVLAMLATPATTEINYYKLDEIDAPKIVEYMKSALKAMKSKISSEGSAEAQLNDVLCEEEVMYALVSISRLPVFSKEFGTAFKDDLDLLHALKQIKYFWNLPGSQLAILMSQLAKQFESLEFATDFDAFTEKLCQSTSHSVAIKEVSRNLPAEVQAKYMENAAYLEDADSHAVYPTSIYRQCDALTLATPDASTIESVMSTTITTTIKIARNVLDPSNHLLFDVYKPLGRCVAVVDDKVDEHFGAEIDNYFAAHNIEFTKMVFSGNEADKGIEDVERILVAMKKYQVARHEPLLVVGGGVIADIAGFATSLYSRNTPYVMLCTSIVSGIDAGPSPRVCCNGFDYKNLYGSYHPPVLTITDRGFWKTLHPGWLRHGVAEIIKMAVMKDLSLFELMEKHGPRAVKTKFGTEGDSVNDAEFQDVCDLVVGKAMEGYVRSEYGNLWETHQCRPHAYGHTWCPGYELPAGMLHGQAVGTDMGFGAYLSFVEGWVSEEEMHRILKCISGCELSLYHPIMDDDEMVWKTHLGIVEKRGGNLCAPIPKPLGFSGYLNDMTKERLAQTMHEYKELVSKYPRGGRGVEELCIEVGLEDPQSKKMQKRAAVEVQKSKVLAGKLDLLTKLKDEGLLSDEQFKAQQEQM